MPFVIPLNMIRIAIDKTKIDKGLVRKLALLLISRLAILSA
jgi:hypothetical protein